MDFNKVRFKILNLTRKPIMEKQAVDIIEPDVELKNEIIKLLNIKNKSDFSELSEKAYKLGLLIREKTKIRFALIQAPSYFMPLLIKSMRFHGISPYVKSRNGQIRSI